MQHLISYREGLVQDISNFFEKLDAKASNPCSLPHKLQYLLMQAAAAKIVARKEIFSAFQEWEHLDQAVAGKAHPLGMTFNHIFN